MLDRLDQPSYESQPFVVFTRRTQWAPWIEPAEVLVVEGILSAKKICPAEKELLIVPIEA